MDDSLCQRESEKTPIDRGQSNWYREKAYSNMLIIDKE